MKMTVGALLLVIAALAGTSAWLWRSLQSERALVRSLEAASTAWETAPPVAAPDWPPATVDEAAALQAAKSTPEETSADDYWKFEQRLLREDEAYREAHRRFRVLELTAGLADVVKALGLSDAQASQLIALLADQELRPVDKALAANPRNEEEMRARKLAASAARYENEREIAAIIGESRLQQWQDYLASMPVRHQVRELGATLFAAADPLRQDQTDALVDIIHAERQRSTRELQEFTANLTWSEGLYRKSHVYRNQRQVELTNAADERIHDAASAVLTVAQLRALDQMLRTERELQEARYQQQRAQHAAWSARAGAD